MDYDALVQQLEPKIRSFSNMFIDELNRGMPSLSNSEFDKVVSDCASLIYADISAIGSEFVRFIKEKSIDNNPTNFDASAITGSDALDDIFTFNGFLAVYTFKDLIEAYIPGRFSANNSASPIELLQSVFNVKVLKARLAYYQEILLEFGELTNTSRLARSIVPDTWKLLLFQSQRAFEAFIRRKDFEINDIFLGPCLLPDYLIKLEDKDLFDNGYLQQIILDYYTFIIESMIYLDHEVTDLEEKFGIKTIKGVEHYLSNIPEKKQLDVIKKVVKDPLEKVYKFIFDYNPADDEDTEAVDGSDEYEADDPGSIADLSGLSKGRKDAKKDNQNKAGTETENLKSKDKAAASSAKSKKGNSKKAVKETMELSFQQELDQLIGLADVKREFSSLINWVKMNNLRSSHGLSEVDMAIHSLFVGPPGTGKTTIARLFAQALHEIGFLQKGHLVEVDRGGLVGEYVGQTAVKTGTVLASALDGVLFIDEAYALDGNSDNDFGKEAIATILKFMEDNRNRIVVIAAGYPQEMADFIELNSGMKSRFTRKLHFQNYTIPELVLIFEKQAQKHEIKLTEADRVLLSTEFGAYYERNKENFGNGRFVRTFFERVISAQFDRLGSLPGTSVKKTDLQSLAKEDILFAATQFANEEQ